MRSKTMSLSLGLLTLLAATPAFAAANLRVTIPAPAPTHVYDAIDYDVVVTNDGNKPASAVNLKIALPRTHTSPQVRVMGTLVGHDSRCTLVGTELRCSLGALAKGATTVVSFGIELPEAAETLSISASATTTSAENTTADNAAVDAPALLHYAVAIAGEAPAVNRHCTGQALTSFFECTTAPSSISAHDTVLHADGTLSFPAEPEYDGAWSQPTADSLVFTYTYGGEVVAEFAGHGTDTNCFEGMVMFPGSAYVSPYEVCL
jgi:hypothetical protein